MTIEQPIVVRLDGTNAEEGRKVLADAAPEGLYVEATMLDGARRAVELAAMSDWRSRAEAYRNAPEQREGEDLDLIVRWAEGSRTALDVATGGGHVARRLREAGLQVVSADPAPGMQPDVICRAEDLPFADGAFDLVVSRIAPHHFEDIAAAVAEMARVSNDLVVVEDTLYVSEAGRGRPRSCATRRTFAPTPRTSGGRCSAGAGLEVEQVEEFEKRHPLEEWLDRSADAGRRPAARQGAARRPDRGGRVRGHEARDQGAEGGVVAIIVDKETKLVVQGLTGSEGSFHGLRNKRYGTQVVAGVTPGKGGQDVEGIPVFDTVADAVAETGANTTMVFVPARFAADAIYEAVDAGIGTVICIAEGLPAHEMLQIYNFIRPKGVTMLGPNCPGALSPGKANVGIIPAEIFAEGNIGLVSRSGTLTYQIGHELTQMGLGNSTIVGIGGDPVVGSSFIDVLGKFQADPQTEYVVMVGEIGGDEEEKAAAFIEEKMTKPVVAYIAGFTAPPGQDDGPRGRDHLRLVRHRAG